MPTWDEVEKDNKTAAPAKGATWDSVGFTENKPTQPKVPQTTQADLGSTNWLGQLSDQVVLNPGGMLKGAGNALSREIGGAGGMLKSMFNPSTYINAASAPETPEEVEQFGKGHMAKMGPTGRLATRLVVAPALTAGDWYASDAPNKFENALTVAPEAIGQGAGAVVGGKLLSTAANAARAGAARGGAPLPEGAEGPVGPTMPERLGQVGRAAQHEIGGENIPETVANATKVIGRLPAKAVRGAGKLIETYPKVATAATGAIGAGIGAASGVPLAADALPLAAPWVAKAFGWDIPKNIAALGDRMQDVGLSPSAKGARLIVKNMDAAIVAAREASKLQKPYMDAGIPVPKDVANKVNAVIEAGEEKVNWARDAAKKIGILGKQTGTTKSPKAPPVGVQPEAPAVAAPPTSAAVEKAAGVDLGNSPRALMQDTEGLPPVKTFTPEPKAAVIPNALKNQIGNAVDEAVGNKPAVVKPVNVGKPEAPRVEPIPGHTPVKSTAMESYKYDPTTGELQVLRKGANNGQVYQGVKPEEVSAAEEAIAKGESAMRTFQKIENAHAKAGVIDRTGKVTLNTRGTSAEGRLEGKNIQAPRTSKMGDEEAVKFINEHPVSGSVFEKAGNKPEFDRQVGKIRGLKGRIGEPGAPEDLVEQELRLGGSQGGVFAAPKNIVEESGWVNSTVPPDAFLDKVAPGQSMEYKLGLDRRTGKNIPDIPALIEAYRSGKPVPPVELTYDASGNVTGADGIKRALAAKEAGIDRIPIRIKRGK
jgi:hypothetical protein